MYFVVCGVFGDFQGPAIPEGWMGDEFIGGPDIRNPFPWVVNIYQGNYDWLGDQEHQISHADNFYRLK